jgi:hypothetical protein
MESIGYIVFICFTLPFLLGIPVVRKESRIILLFVIIGMSCCLFISELDGLIYNWLGLSMYYVTTNITPMTEELIKMVPVILFAAFISREREELLTIAFVTGLGFALMENSTILVKTVLVEGHVNYTWALIRTLGAGLLHSLCTTMIGMGISLIKIHRKLVICGTFALYSMAVVYHSIYNSLIQSDYRYVGALLPTLTYIPIVIVLIRMRKSSSAS